MHRDAALDAANFFENLCGLPKAPFVWKRIRLGTVGGPIYIPHLYDGRNRTFFFAGYDGSRLRLGTTLNGNAPSSSRKFKLPRIWFSCKALHQTSWDSTSWACIPRSVSQAHSSWTIAANNLQTAGS